MKLRPDFISQRNKISNLNLDIWMVTFLVGYNVKFSALMESDLEIEKGLSGPGTGIIKDY